MDHRDEPEGRTLMSPKHSVTDIYNPETKHRFISLSAPASTTVVKAGRVSTGERNDEDATEDDGFFPTPQNPSNPAGTPSRWSTTAEETSIEQELFSAYEDEPPINLHRSSEQGLLGPEDDIKLYEFPHNGQPMESVAPATRDTIPSLHEKECTTSEVLRVWENCSKFIIQKTLEGYAVRIPGLGTFTHTVLANEAAPLSKANLNLKQNRRVPVFKISQHLKDVYGLVEDSISYQCNAPIVSLNHAAIAASTKLSLGIIDGIITVILQTFARGIITQKSFEFPFPYIGKLYVQDKKVRMHFYHQFFEELSFDYGENPTYLADMTPLSHHRPQRAFQSVFHFQEVVPVLDKLAMTSRSSAEGNVVKNEPSNNSGCEFLPRLDAHSKLLLHCSCCKPPECQNDPCTFIQNIGSIGKSCCTKEHANFTFRQPDGSTFTPEPLYTPAKTGNPLSDKLLEDKCLLQQAFRCWLKRDVVSTLGIKNVAKHYERDYFSKLWTCQHFCNDGRFSSKENPASTREEEKVPAEFAEQPVLTVALGECRPKKLLEEYKDQTYIPGNELESEQNEFDDLMEGHINE